VAALSPGTPRSKYNALKADLLDVKETVKHYGEILSTDCAEGCATALNTESNLQWLSKKVEDQGVALRSALRDMELNISKMGQELSELKDFTEEMYKETPTHSQMEAQSKRLKNIEASLYELKEGSDDPEARKKLKSLSREKEQAEEANNELSEEVRKAKKAKGKLEQELTRRNEAFAVLQREFDQFKERLNQQHQRRSKAAQIAWQNRKNGASAQPAPQEDIEEYEDEAKPVEKESEEKPEAKLTITMPSSSSSSSSFKVPIMKVSSPWAPGGIHNKQGLGTGKAPPKPKLELKRKHESESEEYEEDAEEVREAWKKKSKKSKESDSE
jgi:chromosome segregation ATPase